MCVRGKDEVRERKGRGGAHLEKRWWSVMEGGTSLMSGLETMLEVSWKSSARKALSTLRAHAAKVETRKRTAKPLASALRAWRQTRIDSTQTPKHTLVRENI